MYSLFLGIFFKKNFFWFITPLLIVFAFFSKQIPAAYIGILFGVVIFYYFFVEKSMSKKNFLYLCAGFLFSVLLISSVFLINEIPIKNFLTQYIYYPLSLGEKRFSDLNLDYGNFFGQFKFIFFSLIPLVVSLIIIINKFGTQRNARLSTITENIGIDIETQKNTPVYSVLDGVISVITYLRNYGNTIIISHGSGYFTVYANVAEISVKENEYILSNTQLGTVGRSENPSISNSYFLHFEIRKDETILNPEQWIKK